MRKIEQVEVDLEGDRFTVTIGEGGATNSELIAVIGKAGYEAAVVGTDGESSHDRGRMDPEAGAGSTAISKLVADALEVAARQNKLLIIDFVAKWCPACRYMLDKVWTAPEVVAELDHFLFLEVDTDQYPEVSKHYRVAGIPDARIMLEDGTEVGRIHGKKSVEEVLATLRGARKAEEDGD